MKSILTKQSRAMWEYALARQGVEIPAPELNKAAANGGQYVSSFSKRTSECRRYARSLGGDFVLSRDEWKGQQRNTFYTLTLPKEQGPDLVLDTGTKVYANL